MFNEWQRISKGSRPKHKAYRLRKPQNAGGHSARLRLEANNRFDVDELFRFIHSILEIKKGRYPENRMPPTTGG